MNQSPEKDLLGFVLGALDAQEQRNLQTAIDADPQLEDKLLAIKHALSPLDDLDTHGGRPGLARRTCELVANLGQPPIRRLDPTALTTEDLKTLTHSADHAAVASVLNGLAQDEPSEQKLPPPALSGIGISACHTPSSLIPHPSSLIPPPTPANLSHQAQPLHFRGNFSFVDLAVAAGVMLLLAGILFPAISYTRHQSRITHCQDNLRQLGTRLITFSEANQNRLIELPKSGPLSVVGAIAPMIKEKGFVESDSLFSCAGVAANPDQPPVRIPSIQTIQNAVGDQLIHLQRTMGGHFGYTMGYQTKDGYQAPMNSGRPNVVWIADAPSFRGASRISLNHGGRGQNCLFEDGHVQFVSGDSIGIDAIFVNDYNVVAPGCHPEDNVIAPSHLSPQLSLAQ